MASGPYPPIEINLGETLPFLWDRFLRILGKDAETADLKAWFTNLQRKGVIDASTVQCIGMHSPLPIQQIYQPTKLVWMAPYLTVTRKDGKPEVLDLPSSCVKPDWFFETPTSAVIMAGPGWGKTTLLHHLLMTKMESENYVPVLITLRNPSAIEDLTRLVAMVLRIKKLHRGLELLLLVDGYDEISDEARKLVSDKLLSYLASGVGRFYLSCREYYQVYGLKVPHVGIAPFDDEDQERFAQSFASAFGSGVNAKLMLEDLRKRGMHDLLKHPLLLAMVCIVKSGSMSLHSKSVLMLIERAVETLSFRWDEGKGVTREEKLPVDGRDRVRCLMRIAFNSKDPQVAEAVVMEQARAQLDLLRWDWLDERTFMMETARFYGILVPKDNMSWEFVHKTLHDYLAARYWVETGKFSSSSVRQWNSRAAYAASLSADATESMQAALSKKTWFPAFIEMLSNDAPFDHPTIANALVDYYERNPKAQYYRDEGSRIVVHLDQDFIRVASTKFLLDLAFASCNSRGKARDTFFAYSIAELRDRGIRLTRTGFAHAVRAYGQDFKFAVNRYGRWENVFLHDLIPD
jgi:hypothetical protein